MTSKLLLLLLLTASCSNCLPATTQDASTASAHRARLTLFVSKLGDNPDGSCWAKAFKTIQTALDAVPDDRGGHRIIVRPDTYTEANLFPSGKGATGAYNELIGDFDGALGSGTRGWVVIDSGDADEGFKSYDWWGTIRAYKKAWSNEHKEETFPRSVVGHVHLSPLDPQRISPENHHCNILLVALPALAQAFFLLSSGTRFHCGANNRPATASETPSPRKMGFHIS